MFARDETKSGHPVMDAIKPECEWVFRGEGVPTIKLDGTNVKIENGELFKRQKPKDRDYDEASYVPCDRANPADQWAWEGFDSGHEGDGIYELTGPKVQGNPYNAITHHLFRVVPAGYEIQCAYAPVRTFDGLRECLSTYRIEGLVFHHPDGRMAKIKRRDFGLSWPVK